MHWQEHTKKETARDTGLKHVWMRLKTLARCTYNDIQENIILSAVNLVKEALASGTVEDWDTHHAQALTGPHPAYLTTQWGLFPEGRASAVQNRLNVYPPPPHSILPAL